MSAAKYTTRADGMKCSAVLSPCGVYRYWLERCWADTGRGFVNFVMLNPSTADAVNDDATIRKCIGFAKRWGYDGLHVVNLFALRATKPAELRKHPNPIGPDNDTWIEASLLSAEKTVVAWGAHGKLQHRDEAVRRLLAGHAVYALKINADGSPKHPLYVPYDAPLVPFTGGES